MTGNTRPAGALEPARQMGRFNRWDTPWLNPKLLIGVGIIALILLAGLLGRLFWNTDLAFTASSPLNLPPYGFVNTRGQIGELAHPLGTENSGRDMLALLILGAPNSFLVGVVAAFIGMTVGIILGFSAGFIGGRLDDFIRLISDVTITIPALMVLIVIQSVLRQIDLTTMALLLAMFAWPSPTRLIRSQVLSMRQSGYVRMAQLSGGVHTLHHVQGNDAEPHPVLGSRVLSATRPGRFWRRSASRAWV